MQTKEIATTACTKKCRRSTEKKSIRKDLDKMSKMSELSQVLDELITCGETLIHLAQDLKECFSEPDEPTKPQAEETAEAAKSAPLPTKEDVRALLARKANESGGAYKVAVKALVKKYGNGGSLSDVPAKAYPALVAELEELKDA